MNNLGGRLSGMKAIADMMNSYESRKVARDEAGNITVSTAYTTDEGYETALIDSDGRVYPVERYESRADSMQGHAKWLEFAKSGEKQITRLSGLEDCVPEQKFTLRR